jgi:hypothetical protein
MSARSVKRFILLPFPFAALCIFSFLRPGRLIPPQLHTWIAAPIYEFPFTFFLGWEDYGISYETALVLLRIAFIVLAIVWSSVVFLPFWIDFRVGSLSLLHTRILFLGFGVVATVAAWYHLFYHPSPTDI